MADGLTRVRRHPERGSNDKDLLLDILESGLVCQIAFQLEGQPFIIPMSYYNDPDFIYFHGSPVARISNALKEKGKDVRLLLFPRGENFMNLSNLYGSSL